MSASEFVEITGTPENGYIVTYPSGETDGPFNFFSLANEVVRIAKNTDYQIAGIPKSLGDVISKLHSMK